MVTRAPRDPGSATDGKSPVQRRDRITICAATNRGGRMGVCDADSHALEPMAMWQEYVEPRYRARAPRLFVDEIGIERMEIDGKVMNPGPFPLGGVALPGGLSDPVTARSNTYDK